MNLHNIAHTKFELVLEYCSLKFPDYWHWRMGGEGLLEYSTEQQEEENRFWHILVESDYQRFEREAIAWQSTGKPHIRDTYN